MVNSVSAVNFASVNSTGNSVSSMSKSVFIDGKFYKVRKEPYNNPMQPSLVPQYQEYVIVDGEKHVVRTVNNPLTCDGTMQVVVVNGKQYRVNVQ